MPQRPQEGMLFARLLAPWTECQDCGNYWCNLHDMHAHDCECPAVEEWERSPYEPQAVSPP